MPVRTGVQPPRDNLMKKPAGKSATTTAPDAIALLKADHAAVTALFEQFDKAGDKAAAKKLKLARTICNELKVHTHIEEEICYPAVLAVLPKEKDLMDEAEVEHEGAKKLMAEIDAMQPGDD